MIDGTFQAPRCSPSRHQRFGVLSTVGGKGGLGMTVLERGRPERLHRLDAEGDHLVDEPFGIVEDGLQNERHPARTWSAGFHRQPALCGYGNS